MAKFIVSPMGGGKVKVLFPKPTPIDMKEYMNLTQKYNLTPIMDKRTQPWKLNGVITTPAVFETFLRDKGYDEQSIVEFRKSL
jgi:hypothetical protein